MTVPAQHELFNNNLGDDTVGPVLNAKQKGGIPPMQEAREALQQRTRRRTRMGQKVGG